MHLSEFSFSTSTMASPSAPKPASTGSADPPQGKETDSPGSASYSASCHCGAICFTVTLTQPLAQQQPISCNCTICSRNGYLLVYPLRSNLVITQGADVLKSYSFGRKRNLHQFCERCGSSVFFDPRMAEHGESPDLMGVNVRMFKDIKLDELKLKHFDGLNIWPFIDSSA
ncbi:uncharacterized protein BDZ99DRAFT_570899 [Mytilinidion resinicola]|uniref:CENP-V/GFA domain-containing protein n=1 Tax=Mytilinidion resinicola TaxID=574789 RepID=A0A6A6YNE5_9PEZI|nr:uncharacterized protein BDZ99DRAFT_570899 [Mytilinidion resinicola]KAF2810310.1 hypothetical protein BDZ99DRAFT_570899 [Mytilinidion resinicola]